MGILTDARKKLQQVLTAPFPKQVYVQPNTVKGKLAQGLSNMGGWRDLLENNQVQQVAGAFKNPTPQTNLQKAGNTGVDIASNMLLKTFQGGYNIASATNKPKVSQFNVPKLATGVGQTVVGGLNWAGAAKPLTALAYTALPGAITTASELLRGSDARNALNKGVGASIEFLPKALPMAGVIRGTQPLMDKLVGGASAAIRLPLKSATNVGQGLLIDRSIDSPTTTASVAMDALFPVAGDILPRVFKSADEAMRSLEAKVVKALGGKIRNNRGFYTTAEKYAKKTRAYAQTGKYAVGAFLGFEPYQDEQGNWKVKFDDRKALLGIGLMFGGTKALEKSGDVVSKAVKEANLPKVNIPKPLEPLANEARKYGSAEEFLSANKIPTWIEKITGKAHKPTDSQNAQSALDVLNKNGYKNLEDFYNQAKGGVSDRGASATQKVVQRGQNANQPAESVATKLQQSLPNQVGEIARDVGQKTSQSVPSSVASITDKDLISNLTTALKEAKSVRGTQEQLYTKARSQKYAKMMSARDKMAGEKGFFREKGALSGELPKAEYESVRQSFTQEKVDRLFNMIKSNKSLDEWEKLNAQTGLSKILGEKGGVVPTNSEIELLYKVYGKDFTEAVLSKRSLLTKLGEYGMQLYNLPRSFMAGAGDLSATLMQNLVFAYRHPVMTAKNFGAELKFFAHEGAYQKSMQEISQRPNYELMKKAKIALTDVSPIVTKREEEFMASWAEKIPGIGKLIRASGRAYTGFLNKMRADVFDQMIGAAKSSGKDVNDAKFLGDVGHFINAATGRGDLGSLEKFAPILAQGLFSSRKLAGAVQMINPVFYIKADPMVRKEALKTMLSFIGGATLITELADLAGADVSKDPTSADFGKIKIGNTRFNMYGPYQQMAVLMARLWKGYGTSSTSGKVFTIGEGYKPVTRLDLISRFFESKEHPTLSLIMGAIRGQNSLGEKFDLPTETLGRFISMVLSDSYDLYKEHGPAGLLGAIPTILGIPSQTYGATVPEVTTNEAGITNVKVGERPSLAKTVTSAVAGEKQVAGEPKPSGSANSWYRYLKTLSPNEAAQKASYIKKSNPQLYSLIVKERKFEVMGIDPKDANLGAFGVADGERSSEIARRIKKLQTAQEKANYVKKLKDAGIITDEVMKQLVQMKKSGTL